MPSVAKPPEASAAAAAPEQPGETPAWLLGDAPPSPGVCTLGDELWVT